MASVDPSARVDPTAELAADVTIGPGAIVEAGVVVGPGCWIGPYSLVLRGTRLGSEVRVGPAAAIGGPPQDVSFEGGDSGVSIGDRTVIREYATVHRCVQPGGVTKVGTDCMLMATAHVAHECTVGDGVMIANGVTLAGHSSVGERAFLSGSVVVHQFTRIGRLAMVGGGSAVRQDVVPFTLNDGHPARPSGLNKVGLRRAGFSEAQERGLRRAYKALFGSGLRLAEAIEALQELAATGIAEAAEIAEFVGGSERGIARPRCRR